jgi:protein TonB
MKVAYKLAALLSLGFFITVSASANSAEETYLEACRKDPSIPVPMSVVTPNIDKVYSGQTVDVEFTVDTSGMPIALVVKSQTDLQLSNAVVEAVKQWKFTPAHRGGIAIATRVALPVRIKTVDSFDVYAAK